MALSARYLADKSALARFPVPAVEARLRPLLEDGAIASCAIIDLEILYSSRSLVDYEAILQERRALDTAPITQEVMRTAVELQHELARRGHKVIAVTSLDHTNRVTPKHPSGRRLSEVADIVIDNLAPFGDSTLELEGGVGVGAVSSITAAFIAQRITIGVAETMRRRGKTPPVYLSANIPGGDEHNRALEDLYGARIRREA